MTEDVIAKVHLNGNMINSIKNGNNELRKNTDYIFDDQGNITFRSSYLNTLSAGEYDLTVSYDPLGEIYQDVTGNQAPLTTSIKLVVEKHEQKELTFKNLESQYTYGDQPHISVTGGTGDGAITYKSSDETVATVDNDGNIIIHKAGIFTVTATKEGNDDYNPITIEKEITVNKKELSIKGLTAVDRTYNGDTQVSLTGGQLTGTVNGDNVSVTIPVTGIMTDKNADKGKKVNIDMIELPESYKDRYTLKQPILTVDISPKQVNITDVEVEDKVYDGMNQAVIKTMGDTSDFINGDDVSIVKGTCTFDSVNVKENISVSAKGYSLSGKDKDNYVIDSVSVKPANIKKATLHVSVKDITISKGQVIPNLKVEVSGFVNNEDEKLAGFVKPTAKVNGNYDTKDTGIKSIDVIYENGSATDNYQFEYDLTANITINKVAIEDRDYSVNKDLGDWINEDIIITPENGYTKISTDGTQWKDTLILSDEGNNKVTIYLQKDDGTITEGKEISYQIDKTLPSGEISIKDNIFKELIHTVTFGVFCKDSVDVKISGTDSLSGMKSIEYQKVSSMDKYDPDGKWISGNRFTTDDNEKFIVYARITDNAGNVMIINSENIIIYTDSVQTTKSIEYEKLSKSDKDIFIELNGNTIKDISINGTILDKKDYSIEGNKITLKGEYLETLLLGDTVFSVSYNALGNEYKENDKGDKPSDTIFIVRVIKKTLNANDFDVILPTDVIYDTKEHPVTVQLKDEITGAGDISIQYFKDGKEIEGIPTEAGTYTIRVDITEGEYCNAGQIVSENWKYTISKAIPEYSVPEGLEAVYGQNLKDIKLPEGFTWKNPELSVGEAGENTLEVIYTPEDTNNYQVIEGIKVNVTVSKAESKIKITNTLDKVYDGKAVVEPEIEKSGSTGDVAVQYYDKNGHELEKAPANVGEYKVIVSVVGDKNHKETKAEQDFTISKAIPTVNEPDNVSAVHGKKLKDVQLDNGWYWAESETEVTTDVSEYKARINVDDENYDYSNVEGYNSEGHYVERIINVQVSAEENRWLEELSIDSWTYGENAKTPDAKAYKGEVEYSYSTSIDGKYTKEVPVNAGTYYVKATVKATDEYTGLESIKKFEIKKAKPAVSLKQIEITYGEKISLPKGYTLEENADNLSAGKHVIYVTYTPSDTDNYEIIKDIKLTVIVKPKEAEKMPVIEDGDNLVIKDGDKVLVEGEDFEVYVKGAYIHIVFKGNYKGELIRYIGEKKDDKKVKTNDDTSIVGYALLALLAAGMTLTLKKRKEE